MGRLWPSLWARLWITALLTVVGSTCEAAEACRNVVDPAGLSTLCGFAKPEDVQFIRSRSVLIVSEQGWKAPESGGSIAIVPVNPGALRLDAKRTMWPSATPGESRERLIGEPSCTKPPSPTAFSPHGLFALEQRMSTRVAVVGHGAREAVELFELRTAGDRLELEWRGCVTLPDGTAANDVTLHPDGRIFVTNYSPTVHDFRAALAVVKALRGEVTGDVMEWSSKRGWRHLPGTEGAMPNGIVLDESGTRLYVAELGRQRVLEYRLDGDNVTRTGELAVEVMADNLNWTNRGTLLVAGQLRTDSKAWGVAEIDLQTRTVTTLFEKETRIHSVTSATDIGPGIVFGSTADEKIGIARWPAR